jgi:hypothetical protein
MQLDDLKHAWAAHGAMLERSLAIEERLLREVLLRKARIALAPYILWRALEVVIGVAMLGLVARIISGHVAEPRYLLVAGALMMFMGAITAMCAYLLVRSLTLDYGGPVTAVQRDLEHIRLVEYHTLKWTILGGVVAWLPAALILFEAVSGGEALARVDLAWLVANAGAGLAVLGVGHALSRRYVEQPDLGPAARRLADALSGRALRVAAVHLAELERFEREDSPAP